jgi:hypothetical protein
MKAILSVLLLLAVLAPGQAASTINPTNRHAYGANLGWIDWRADGTNGAVVGDYVCSGYTYSANVGWIHLGSGSPVNGIRYQNNATDYGVNHDGFGNLSGFAYGANIGWIQFEEQGAPTVDLKTGRLGGSIYSANCGWISLSNAMAWVQTDSISPGNLGTNGLPVAWELENFNNKNIDPNADPDGDDQSNAAEYLAGTDPLDPASNLRILSFQLHADGTKSVVRWTSVSNRFYYLQSSEDLSLPGWLDSGLGLTAPDGAATQRSVNNPLLPQRFFRIEAIRPLSQ